MFLVYGWTFHIVPFLVVKRWILDSEALACPRRSVGWRAAQKTEREKIGFGARYSEIQLPHFKAFDHRF